mgnify:CR=1 FL=1
MERGEEYDYKVDVYSLGCLTYNVEYEGIT